MAGRSARVSIYEPQILRLFADEGELGRFMGNFGRYANATAKRLAPARSGELRAKQFVQKQRTGPMRIGVRLYNNAEHAKYVHEGTTGPITANGKFMSLPAGGGWRARRAKSVRGQRSQPFIREAVELTRRIIH